MAYELLNLGYSILYLPVTPENCVSVLTNEATWEIFKDKANYDFRFITHGLLESADVSLLEAEKARLTAALEELDKYGVITYNPEALSVLIGDREQPIEQLTNTEFEYALMAGENYEVLLEALREEGRTVGGLLDPATNEYYATALTAVQGILGQLRPVLVTLNASVTSSVINTVNTHIANLAKYTADTEDKIPGRGDCVALIELDEVSYKNTGSNPEVAIIKAINEMSNITPENGKFCAMTVPSVVYDMVDNTVFGNNKKFPGAFHYLACFMNSLQSGFAEWYAAAGYTRGVSSYRIKHTTVTLGEIAINALEPRNTDNSEGSPKFACNVIANFRGSYYLWGNRTAHPLGDANGTEGDLIASHFLNIRQLCTTIKKQLYVACRRFTFDPNSDTLWFNFVNAIKPTLEVMKADQGIRDYKIVKVYTDKKATLKAKIRIIPIEAVEDFDLEVSLEDSFGETAAVVTE